MLEVPLICSILAMYEDFFMQISAGSFVQSSLCQLALLLVACYREIKMISCELLFSAEMLAKSSCFKSYSSNVDLAVVRVFNASSF